jgi:antitoxin component YwqK of YwqJK toxin-antitoxin module
MKKIMMIAVLVVSSVTFAQNSEPKLEEVNGIVKATYYHENGQVQQEGFFADGKLEGKWVSFDQNGVKIAIAEYSNGVKVGNWFFWNNDGLSEVDYSKDNILSVKKWSKGSVAVLN